MSPIVYKPMSAFANFAFVAAGGALGACSRYALTLLIHSADGRLPFATLMANISGSFIAGCLIVWLASQQAIGSMMHLLFVIGFLGSYTTMSTFSVETIILLQAGNVYQALQNVLITMAACLFAAWVGVRLTQWTIGY